MTQPRCPGIPHRGHTVPGEPCPLDRPQLEPPDDAPAYRSWEPDRPRYRVLATPWYGHDHSGRYPADRCAPAGYELEVTRVDDAWLAAAGERAHVPLGVTRCAAPLNPAAARVQVLNYLWLFAEPPPTRVTPDDVELYVPLDPP